MPIGFHPAGGGGRVWLRVAMSTSMRKSTAYRRGPQKGRRVGASPSSALVNNASILTRMRRGTVTGPTDETKTTSSRKFFSGSPLAKDPPLMQLDRVPSRAPTPSDIFQAYVAVLPKWLRRFGVPASDIEDLMQEVWLAACDGTVRMPNNIQEARLELFKVTRVAAVRLRRRQEREAARFVPELEDNGHDFDMHAGGCASKPTNIVDEEELAAQTLGVFEAFECLSPKHQRLARDYYIEGYTIKEMAVREKTPEDRMEKWIWRVRAELEKFARRNRRLDERNKKRRNGALIVPFAFDLDPATRAAFCSIWEVEGECTEFGGGGNRPPAPPRPPVFPVAPILSGITGSAVAAIGLAILVVMLVLFPAGIVALHYFWEPPRVETAQTGLRVPALPSVGAIDDVVPLYPTNLPKAPRAPRPQAARKPVPVNDEPSSGPAFERGASD